jgi:hypothetical protein
MKFWQHILIAAAVLAGWHAKGCKDARAAAIGDGKADDTAALQQQLDKLSAGSVLDLKAKAIYRITGNLDRNKAIIIRGHGATIYYDQSITPWKASLRLVPTLGPKQTWTETLKAGERPALQLDWSKRYIAGYGTDPNDPASADYTDFSDEHGLPQTRAAINGIDHWYRQILSSPDGSMISDLNFTHKKGIQPDYSDGAMLDYALGIDMCRSITLRNISGDVPALVHVGDSEGISIDGLSGKMSWIPRHTASGRAFSAWMARDVMVRNVDVEGSDLACLFMAENRVDGLIMDRVSVRLRPEAQPGQWTSPIWFTNGGSRRMAVLNARIECSKSPGLYLWDCGGQIGQQRPVFGRIESDSANLTPQTPVEELVRIPVQN